MPGVEHIEYAPPVTGISEDAPTYVEGSIVSGGDNVMLTADMTVQELLGQILVELKKLNLRQEIVFEETVNDGDIL